MPDHCGERAVDRDDLRGDLSSREAMDGAEDDLVLRIVVQLTQRPDEVSGRAFRRAGKRVARDRPETVEADDLGMAGKHPGKPYACGASTRKNVKHSSEDLVQPARFYQRRRLPELRRVRDHEHARKCASVRRPA